MRHSILTMALVFTLGVACALLLRLPWSGVGAPPVQEGAHPLVPPTAEQLRGLAQQLATLEPRLQGLAQGLAATETASATRGEQLGTLSLRLEGGLQRLDPLGPRLDSLETQVTRLAPLVPRVTALETQATHLDPLAPRLESLAARIARAETAIQRHETRIEEGSVKLFETLMTLDNAGQAGQRTPPAVASAPRPPAADAPRSVSAAP